MRLNRIHTACLSSISILIVCSLVWTWIGYKSTVVLFDIQKIQGQFIQQLALHKASDAQVANASIQFKTVLQKTLRAYSQKQNVIILEKKMVLAGGYDVTNEVADQLAQAMRASS